jgi:hypothetical protein
MHRLALALGLLLACGDGPPQRQPPPPLPGTTPAADAPATPAPAPAPDDPVARELTEICLATATVAPSLPPNDRFQRALLAAEAAAVSPDSKALVQRLRNQDLGEQSAELRRAVAAAGLTGCVLADNMDLIAGAQPNVPDARAIVTTFEALATVSPEFTDRLLAAACSELSACGRECTPGLAGFAEAEPEQRVLALMRQCASFRAQAGGTTDAAAFAWIRARITAFADASAGLLGPAEAARLAELRAPLGL